MTTFGEYQHAVDVARRERSGLRKGQAYFNVLVDLEPEIVQRLAETAPIRSTTTTSCLVS
jgi:hypothetical protein